MDIQPPGVGRGCNRGDGSLRLCWDPLTDPCSVARLAGRAASETPRLTAEPVLRRMLLADPRWEKRQVGVEGIGNKRRQSSFVRRCQAVPTTPGRPAPQSTLQISLPGVRPRGGARQRSSGHTSVDEAQSRSTGQAPRAWRSNLTAEDEGYRATYRELRAWRVDAETTKERDRT